MQSNILTESAVWPRMERSLLSRRTSPLVRRRFDPQQTDNSPDLHQILCSTGLGIVLLDLDMHIRYFTPAACALFALNETDIGRPLSDLSALYLDAHLQNDTSQVLAGTGGMARVEIKGKGETLYRQVRPYGLVAGQVSGVVISYVAAGRPAAAPETSLAPPPALIAVAVLKAQAMTALSAPEQLCRCCDHLTPRQREVLRGVLAGKASKTIAHDLRISQRTVESHRAAIMQRVGAKSVPDLVRLALFAG